MGYLGVRKGAWTREEDLLLKKCIEIHGEGNWHLVPKRAGLYRCRKSCRLRWLNYLHPNIKLGRFADDEIDLIIRLHKLLGNRWSLIAGRLPGRTANGVKNFWNSHLREKFDTPNKEKKPIPSKKVDVIRPKPWTYATNLTPSKDLQASRDKQLKEECGFFDALWTPEDHAWLWTPEDHAGLWCKNLIPREEEEENQGLYNQNLTDEVLSGSHWDGKNKSKEGGGEWDDLLSSISLWDHQIM